MSHSINNERQRPAGHGWQGGWRDIGNVCLYSFLGSFNFKD